MKIIMLAILSVAIIAAYNMGNKVAIDRYMGVCHENTHNRTTAHRECEIGAGTGNCIDVPAGIQTTQLSECSYYEAVMQGKKVWVRGKVK